MTENIYHIFYVRPHPSGKIHRVNLGKFFLSDGQFEILEDNGLPEKIVDATPAEAARRIAKLSDSMYYEVVNLHDLLQGFHPELLKELKDSEPAGDMLVSIGETAHGMSDDSAEFEYERVGSEGPRKLSISDGQVFLDGHLLTEDEIVKIQENVMQGRAALRRKMKKSEAQFTPSPAGFTSPHMTEDSVVPGVGNLASFKRYKPTDGAYVHVNLHGLRQINQMHGHPQGTLAVASLGKGVRDAARKLGGQQSKTFRIGADHFVAHVPSVESAALVARAVRSHLENIPPINGIHSLSASVGIGDSHQSAKVALERARGARTNRIGEERTSISMHIPGALSEPLD